MRVVTLVASGLWLAGLVGLVVHPARAELRLDTVNTIACAHEGGVCRMPYPTNVYFGIPGKTNGRPFPQGGSIPCTIQSFGDPAPGQPKSCWYAPRITDSGGRTRYRDDEDDRRDGYRAGRDYDSDPRDAYRYRERRYEGDEYRPRRPYEEEIEVRRRYRRDPEDE